MTNRTANVSPQLYARIAGVLYLINIGCGIFGEVFVRGHLIVPGNAVATAHNIMASEFLFRCSVVGDLIMHITDVPITLIFYVLLKPVSKNLALLAAMFSMLQTAVLCANKLNLVTVLLLLGGSGYLKAFDPNQLQVLASLSLAQHDYGFGIGLIFFGVSCLVIGYLMLRSGYFPRTLGVMQAIAGICYLINSFALLLSPTLADKMFPAIVIPSFIGELSTCVWLIVRGVNIPMWQKQVGVNAVV
jgi:hypothetical protein